MVAMRTMLAYLCVDKARIVWFFVCCAVTLILAWKLKNAETVRLRDKIALPAMALIVLNLNPVSAHFLLKDSVETQALRFVWLIPTTAFMGCATVLLVDLLRPKAVKLAVAAAVPFVILCFCNGFYRAQHTWTNTTPNWYKIPPVVVDLCDEIAEDTAYTEKKAIFPMPLNLWVRQYRAEIEMPFAWYGHDWYDETRIALFEAMPPDAEVIDLDKLGENAVKGGYTYIVLAEDGKYSGNIEDYGFEEIYRVQYPTVQNAKDYDKTYVLYRQEGEVQS